MKPLKKWSYYLFYLAAIALYGLYLAALPELNRYLIPCLVSFPGQLTSYVYEQCNTVLALDRFIALALVGLTIEGGVLLILKKHRSLLPLVATTAVLAGLACVAYYWYVPVAEAAVKRAPIILESLK